MKPATSCYHLRQSRAVIPLHSLSWKLSRAWKPPKRDTEGSFNKY